MNLNMNIIDKPESEYNKINLNIEDEPEPEFDKINLNLTIVR